MDYSCLASHDLLRACVETREAAAWEEFVRRYNPLIASVALRTMRRWGDCSRSVLDDLVQETYLKLCAQDCHILRAFEPRQPESICGFLKVVTANVVHDHFKALGAEKRGIRGASLELDCAEPEAKNMPGSASGAGRIERAVLLQEIDRELQRSVAANDLPRSRLIFWLYYRCGLTANAIASLPSVGLTTKGVESVILRLTRLVRVALTEMRGLDTKNRSASSPREGIPQAESF